MKYKCINVYFLGDDIIMNLGDIISIEGTNVFNLTTGMSYHNTLDIDNIKSHLEAITDEYQRTIPEDFMKSDVDRFIDITNNMNDIFKRKNHDYGNSFEQSLNEEGLAASRIRIGDKWNRFKTLSKGKDIQVHDESLVDTLVDMANYAIMTVIWLNKNRGNV